MKYTREKREEALRSLAAGASVTAVSQQTGVARGTIRNWRDAAGLVASPSPEGTSTMDLPAHLAIGVLDRISASEVREADPLVTFREYLEATRILEPSRNQRRLAEKNLSDAGLSRDEAIEFIRDLLWEVGQRFGATSNEAAKAQQARLLDWTIERVRRVNPSLALALNCWAWSTGDNPSRWGWQAGLPT